MKTFFARMFALLLTLALLIQTTSFSFAQTTPSSVALNCPANLDFEQDPAGNAVAAGTIPYNTWAAAGITINSSDPNDHPPMIFNSSSPTGGDTDLGTPHKDFGGPGIGNGGEAGDIGENSQSEGNLLIISLNGNSGNPNDYAGGGTLTFDFATPQPVYSVPIIDVDYGETHGRVRAYDAAGNLIVERNIIAYGNNSAQEVVLDVNNVSSVEVYFPGSGGVAGVTFCNPAPPVLGSIGDFVWYDNDGEGDQDADEPGIPNVTVLLYDDQGHLLSRTTTDQWGYYEFPNLLDGTYEVRIDSGTLPNNLTQTYDLDGSLNNNSGDVVLTPGQHRRDVDFGYEPETPVPLPVTLAYFNAAEQAEGVAVEWQTATETASLGFRLWVETADGRALVDQRTIQSKGITTTEPQSYSTTIKRLDRSATLWLENLDFLGGSEFHGPFLVSEFYGGPVKLDLVDWTSIKDESAEKALKRQLDHQLSLQARVSQVQQSRQVSAETPLVQFNIVETGIYQVSHADLLAAGIDLSGLGTADFALMRDGQPVPISISGDATFGPDSTIQFVGKAAKTLYTDTAIYTLWADAANALRIPNDTTSPTGEAPSYYMALDQHAENVGYDTTSTSGDPFYAARLVAAASPVETALNFNVTHLVDGAAPVTLTVETFGGLDFPDVVDHHVQLELDGNIIADEWFDGLTPLTLSAEISTTQIISGNNSINFKLPHDSGNAWDIVGIESYTLAYPRAFVAEAGGLNFKAQAPMFTVGGFDTLPVIYRVDGGMPTELSPYNVIDEAGQLTLSFSGAIDEARYLMQEPATFLTPDIAPARPVTDITSGSADYLMITHADFKNDLGALVSYHESNGLSVKIVDVADIYDQFSYGQFDPQAIRDYIAHAVENMSVQYVLLIGNDTYDYHDYLGHGSISFLPSFYMQNDHEGIIKFGPADPLYADANDDGVPDVPLGRFPVRNSAELGWMIDKTLTYATGTNYDNSAIFSSDVGFSAHSYGISENLANYWSITETHLDEMGAGDAHTTLVDTINEGVALTVFFGHSGPTTWSWSGLFDSADATALTNNDKPTIVTQFGCWNSYYVLPTYNTLAHQFMGAGGQGAAAVLGGSTLTSSRSDMLLGNLVTHNLTSEEMSVGDALTEAKQALALSNPGLVDAQMGYTLLGDPALKMNIVVPSSVEMNEISTYSGPDATLTIVLLTFAILATIAVEWTRKSSR